MTVFDHPEFDHHEIVHYVDMPGPGLRAIIAVHSTALGPAAGGCRRWRYASNADALTDVLRLSRGMTYKNAIAGLPFGGGKSVILADDRVPKSPELFRAFGRAVETLGGRYITAEDVGISVDDMRIVREQTAYVSGLPQSGESAGGDPSPWTALGVFLGIEASVRTRLGVDSLDGVRVAVQGVGHVGYHLCRMLAGAGAILTVADVNRDNLNRITASVAATPVAPNELLFADVDVLAPCALGNVLNAQTIPRLRASVVAGAANNQLSAEADGERLADRGILYAPDYVINAGGVISVAREYLGQSSEDEVRSEVARIPDRLGDIFAEAESTGRATNVIADELARRIVASGGDAPRTPDARRIA
ncbi:MAG: Glu/Leu/Phe/Val dehydrogenase [Woeseiaceae bacterium]|nr:Glu/Leu/Phe/Val dehydrogenase [Woeseiaceae bacterium]